ncbi:hypothetical protein GCM10023212_44350 [Luteolibacter yonseiensis]|nr:hypothetical protein [Luteolibacter yonseiensis]
MNPNDLADATARALDLLDPDDPANPDPRLFREPCLAAEIRTTRETAADVWLAVSPLHVAPAEVLPRLMAEISGSGTPARKKGFPMMPWLAASGWAAAAVVAIVLWPSETNLGLQNQREKLAEESFSSHADHQTKAEPLPASRENRISHDIARLQERLADARRDRGDLSPRVINLTAPGTVPRTEEESRQRVRTILSHALRSTLEVESAASSDPATLVIERGWLPDGLPFPTDDGMIRHRNFPEHAWREMGLLRSEDGEFYDPEADIVWSADPEGRGFIGQKATADEDITRFNDHPDTSPRIATKPRTLPEGFIIKSAVDDTAEVVIDQVPPPATGTQHLLIVTDSSGHQETIPVTPPAPSTAPDEGGVSTQSGPLLAGGDTQPPTGVHIPEGFVPLTVGSGTIVMTIPNFSSTNSFQLIERSDVPNGQPDRIIVESGP